MILGTVRRSSTYQAVLARELIEGLRLSLTGTFCYLGVVSKNKFGYDDSLDVVGVHGVGGTWEALATGLCASRAINDSGADGLFFGNPALLGVQAAAVGVTAIYALGVIYILLKYWIGPWDRERARRKRRMAWI